MLSSFSNLSCFSSLIVALALEPNICLNQMEYSRLGTTTPTLASHWHCSSILHVHAVCFVQLEGWGGNPGFPPVHAYVLKLKMSCLEQHARIQRSDWKEELMLEYYARL